MGFPFWFKKATCDICHAKAVSAERVQFRCRRHDRKMVEAWLAEQKRVRSKLRRRVVVVRRKIRVVRARPS